MHATNPYLLDPIHKITIGVYGIGGTGSKVLTGLVSLNEGLKAIGHPGIVVSAYDFDEVSESNIGRQQFYSHDVGEPKAEKLIKRINVIYGLDWKSYNTDSYKENIIITCLDTVKGRKKAYSKIKKHQKSTPTYEQCHYWFDVGNGNDKGQLIIGNFEKKKSLTKVPNIADYSHNFKDMEDNPNESSCSLRNALEHQDLMINQYAATITLDFLWKLFRHGKLEFNGAFFNISKMIVVPIPLKD